MKKIHWPAIGAALLSVAGFVAANSDAISKVVPPKYAAAVIGAGIIAQAVTHPATQDTVQASGYLMGSGRDDSSQVAASK